MKEPRRLLSHGATDFERQLLRAVVSERPSAVLRSRMQRGLGLVGPLAWASSVKAMVATAAGKLLGGTVLSSLIAVAGVAVLSSAPSESRPRAAAVEHVSLAPVLAEPPAPVVVAAPPAALAPVAEAPPVVAEPAPVEPAPAPAGLAATPAEDDDSRLREEIALLDAARGSLQNGNRSAAAASLRTYRERFPDGILRREANVLRRRAEQKRSRQGR